MPASKRSTARASFEDDAPDLSTPEWQAKFAAVKVKRGRPKAAVTKVSQNLRVDRDVLDAYKATGPGWQTRMNEALRKGASRLAGPARGKSRKRA